jgi:hypothetical protein
MQETNMKNFIYERVNEAMQKKFRRLTLFLTILTGLLSLLSVSDLGIDQTEYKTLLLVIRIVVAVISFVSFVVTSYIKHAKIEDKIQSYTSYIGKLVNFTSNLSTIIDVKPELRPDADKFITDNRTTYSTIHRDSPYIDNKYYDKSKMAYDKYVLDADIEKNETSINNANNVKVVYYDNNDNNNDNLNNIPNYLSNDISNDLANDLANDISNDISNDLANDPSNVLSEKKKRRKKKEIN